jgi:octaprenyl-diphosphate synthase
MNNRFEAVLEEIKQLSSSRERFAHAISLVPELADVESTIRQSFRSDVALMRDIPEYLLQLGGKRIRPALTLLTAKAFGVQGTNRDLLNVCAGIELIHMATLLHDDIIDDSPIRRHRQSPYAKYGTPATLLSGDFLLTRAFGLCAKLDDTIITATEQACIELVEGEALETLLHQETHSRATSLTIAHRKTAALFRLAAFCAAHIAQQPHEVCERLSAFGQSLGVAFQIIDDILDVTSDEATLGKRPGLDITERKPSLVNVLWIESGDPEAKRLLSAPQSPEDERAFAAKAIEFLRTSAIITEAKQLAVDHAEAARDELYHAWSLSSAQASPYPDALNAVIDFALERLR